jgi:polysaccharide pyruvyl transferase WcaK-like protein
MRIRLVDLAAVATIAPAIGVECQAKNAEMARQVGQSKGLQPIRRRDGARDQPIAMDLPDGDEMVAVGLADSLNGRNEHIAACLGR